MYIALNGLGPRRGNGLDARGGSRRTGEESCYLVSMAVSVARLTNGVRDDPAV